MATEPAATLRQDTRTIALVGLAHATSHFFHLLLPPLFPAFIRDFGLSYAELGLLVTVFFAISGVGQASAGFLVDRVGARPVLFGAMACFVAAALAAAAAQGFGGLMLAAVLAGIGNAPFHPVDFTILNRRVSAPRLGHAFSIHGISGSLGWAAAPMFLVGLSALGGHWRWACAGAALWALFVLALLAWRRADIDDRELARPLRAGAKAGTPATTHAMAFLRLPSLWLCFTFFMCSAVSLAAIQGFAGPALTQLHGLPTSTTAFVITGYMLMSAAGTLVGGFLPARVTRLETTIGVAMASAAALLLGAAGGVLPGALAAAAVALAGFGTGIAGPSRDLLIRQAAPPGATGRVYGTVYSGLDVGFAIAAPVFGRLLDQGHAGGVLAGAAMALMTGIVCAALVGRTVAATRQVATA